MPAPVVLSVTPQADAQDVVLGTQIVVTFDQPVDPATVNEGSFLLVGPGQTQIIGPDQFIAQDPTAITGREYITGAFSWNQDHTVLTFNPGKALQPSQKYEVTVLGAEGSLVSDGVANPGGEKMANSYRWSFNTGDLNVVTPPQPSPIPEMVPSIDPKLIVVKPHMKIVGNDLSQQIEVIFPADIDVTSFLPSDVLVSIEAILGDLGVELPSNLSTTMQINGNKLTFTVGNWPAE